MRNAVTIHFDMVFSQRGCAATHRPTTTIRAAHLQLNIQGGCGLANMALSQRSLQDAPIFRRLLKVAVDGAHQCDFLLFLREAHSLTTSRGIVTGSVVVDYSWLVNRVAAGVSIGLPLSCLPS